MSRLSAASAAPSGPQGEPLAPERMLSRWILSVLDHLEALWHNEANPPQLGHGEPLEGLVLTVLSQNTNDRNRDAAFARLKERFASWDAVVRGGAAQLEDAVRPAGLAPTKARHILEILNIVKRDFGEYSIAPLAERGRDEARRYLIALPGVGAKTAACVLLFDMGLPAFPVDTHVGRIARRVGFAAERAPAEDISLLLERETPPSRYLGGHVNMIEHGRAICRARAPQCGACPLTALCNFGRALIVSERDAEVRRAREAG